MNWRKFLGIAVCMVLVNASCGWAAYYEEGNSGLSESSAYVIDSVEDLTELRDRVNNGTEPSDRYYKLTQNLTISG